MRHNNSILILFLFFTGLLIPLLAYPCGACYEDNLASVYGHEAIEKAKAHPDKFEFVVLKIEGILSQETADQLARWLSEKKGVEAQTVKVSMEQKSAGFLVDKKKLSHKKIISYLHERFPNLGFTLLQYDSLEAKERKYL